MVAFHILAEHGTSGLGTKVAGRSATKACAAKVSAARLIKSNWTADNTAAPSYGATVEMKVSTTVVMVTVSRN